MDSAISRRCLLLRAGWRVGGVWAVLAMGWGMAAAGAAVGGERTEQAKIAQALLRKFCFDCHGEGSEEGNLALDGLFAAEAYPVNRPQWWKVLKNIRAGVMPPAEKERPTDGEVEAIAQWIKFEALGIDPLNPDPGRRVVRRLNQREYDNTVDDLLGIEFDASLIFPADDSGHGFDNVGDALSLSPLLMEKYLRAAQAIVEGSVPRVTWVSPQQEFSGREFEGGGEKSRGESLSSKTAATVKRTARIDNGGRYRLRISAKLQGSFDFDPSRYVIVWRVDGKELSRNEYGWDENKLVEQEFVEEWQAGERELSVELIPVAPREVEEAPAAERTNTGSTFARYAVQRVRIEGPLGAEGRVHPANYGRFFSREEPPTDAKERAAYAEEILERFAVRAYRSPVDRATVERLSGLAASVYQRPGETFESGIAHALVAILASPRFLFRVEGTSEGKPGGDEGRFVEVDEYALASRLSYLFWSTMPDEELFGLAAKGELRRQAPAQMKRMLADPRSEEFLRNFVGQWLRTRDVTQVTVDPLSVLGYQTEYEQALAKFQSRRRKGLRSALTPEEQAARKRLQELRAIAERYNDELKRAMRKETETYVGAIFREDRSLLELLDSDYTYVNEKLADLYGLSGVQGAEMRRVTLPADSARGGVLTQAAVLWVTSNPTRTSPVKRGLFVLDNVLGMPAPPAPAGVPDLEESAKKFGDREPPLRELLAAHRESALCASCHARMDPLGIALENFNALGIWRESEKGEAIDASGQLITGEMFKDIRELKKILKERHAAKFYRCVTEKLLTYALGRGLEAGDEQTIDTIVERLSREGGRAGALLQGVVESAPFQKQRRPEVVTVMGVPMEDVTSKEVTATGVTGEGDTAAERADEERQDGNERAPIGLQTGARP